LRDTKKDLGTLVNCTVFAALLLGGLMVMLLEKIEHLEEAKADA